MPGEEKEYGLILPNKQKEITKPAKRVLNPLATSDDELEKEEGESLNWVEASLKKSAGNSGQQSLQKRLLREAVEEDSTVFQYDEVYDDIKASQQEEKERKTQQIAKKPKYIETILKQSEKRKLENERRLERKVQKERESEGNEFADKESFVTPSYLKKLEELKKAEQAEQREKLIEEKIDVHKHKNFGVFYNHLFKQRIGEKEIKQEPEDSEQPGTSSENNIQKKSQTKPKNYRTQHDLSDEEPAPGERLNIQIKKEVVTSSSSEDETSSESREAKANKFLNKNDRNNSLFKQKSRSKERNIRRRSTSRDKSDNKYRKRESENADKRYIDKSGKDGRHEIENSRNLKRQTSKSSDRKERSKDKNIDRSKDKDRRERSKERSKDRSRDKDIRDESKERNRNISRDRERRNRSRERNRQRSRDRRDRSSSRGRRDRSRSRGRRDRSRSRDKNRSRSRSRDKKEKQDRDKKESGKRSRRSRSKDKMEDKYEDSKRKLSGKNRNVTERENNENNNNKENGNTENGDNHDRINVFSKQSINTKLGTTNVNKMKIEDRIKRFKEIFAKRTINKTFDSAVCRYFQRKSEGGSSGLA